MEGEKKSRQYGLPTDVRLDGQAMIIAGEGAHLIENAYNTHEPWKDKWSTGRRERVLDVDKTVQNIMADPKPEESEFYTANNMEQEEIRAYVAERFVRMALEQGVPFRTTVFDARRIQDFRTDIQERQKNTSAGSAIQSEAQVSQVSQSAESPKKQPRKKKT